MWKTRPPAAGNQRAVVGNEDADVWADLDGGTNALKVRRVFGSDADELVARVGTGGAVSWYLTDRQGSVVGLTDAYGVVRDAVTYDGFGRVFSQTDAAYGDRYQYTGREFDNVGGGVLHLRDRVLSLDLLRFLTPDRLGFAAGDSNLTRYVGNGFPNGTDPSGMRETDGFTHGELEKLLKELRIAKATNAHLLDEWRAKLRAATRDSVEQTAKGIIDKLEKESDKLARWERLLREEYDIPSDGLPGVKRRLNDPVPQFLGDREPLRPEDFGRRKPFNHDDFLRDLKQRENAKPEERYWPPFDSEMWLLERRNMGRDPFARAVLKLNKNDMFLKMLLDGVPKGPAHQVDPEDAAWFLRQLQRTGGVIQGVAGYWFALLAAETGVGALIGLDSGTAGWRRAWDPRTPHRPYIAQGAEGLTGSKTVGDGVELLEGLGPDIGMLRAANRARMAGVNARIEAAERARMLAAEKARILAAEERLAAEARLAEEARQVPQVVAPVALDAAAQNIAGLTVAQAKQLEAKILEVIPGAKEVRVFGSRTRGKSTTDIDVVVIGEIIEDTSAVRSGMKKVQELAKKLGIPKPEGKPRVDFNFSPSAEEFLKWSREQPNFDPLRGVPNLRRME